MPMKKRLTRHIALRIVLCICAFVASSCSSTKYVPDGQYLLDDVSVRSDNKDISTGGLTMYIRQQPNTKWFNLFKTQLHIYSLSGRDSTKWVNRALRRVGTAPVIYSAAETERSRQEIEKAVRNMGYIGARVSTRTETGRKRLRLTYDISSGRPYIVNSIDYDVPDTLIGNFMEADSASTLLREGMYMDINRLDAERNRITANLQRNGFYRFNKEYISFTADTVRGTYGVDLTLHLNTQTADSASSLASKQYRLNKVSFLTDYDMFSSDTTNAAVSDSMLYRGFPIYFRNRLFIRPRVIMSNQRLIPGHLYNSQDVQTTYENFNRLSVMRYTNVRFQEVQRGDSALLNAYVLLNKNRLQSVSFEVEGTNSAGDLGAGASVSYSHRNLFRGSETFTFRLRGSYEAVSGLQGQYRNESYTELGAEASLDFPRFVFPFTTHDFRQRIRANTTFNLQYSYQMRPEFTRIIASTGWGYKWGYRSSNTRHQIDLLDVSYLYMPWIDPSFRERYLNQENNYILRYNYENRFIIRTGYTYVYNSAGNATGTVQSQNSYTLRFNVEAAGNLMYALAKASGMHRNSDGEYSLLNIPFAQYVKGDIDYARNVLIDPKNSIAWHVGLGIAYPYGNATLIPFEKRYFSGGANSVRGWSVRDLGPGSFAGDGNFMNQTGDLKLDASIEYRTDLFWKLRGAAFVDAGNIWTLRNYESQPGGRFRFGKFYKQIAVAYGIGFRLDLDFFILRIDGGMKAINPVYSSGRQRYPIIHPKFSRDFAFHFAVGYPF